jgi:hypothetical protein
MMTAAIRAALQVPFSTAGIDLSLKNAAAGAGAGRRLAALKPHEPEFPFKFIG